MNYISHTKLTAMLIIWLSIMPLLTACGSGGGIGDAIDFGNMLGSLGSGGSDGDSTDCTLVVLVVTAGFGCEGSGANQSASPAPDRTGGGNARQVAINRFAEYEPNNTLDNANPVQFGAVASEVLASIEIVGSVQDDSDPSDFFVFTPNRSGYYSVYLCADSCDERLIDDAVYLMVYDQSQTTIDGTPVGTVEEQRIEVELTAGLAYYVEVHGYNTAAMSYDYKLVIVE